MAKRDGKSIGVRPYRLIILTFSPCMQPLSAVVHFSGSHLTSAAPHSSMPPNVPGTRAARLRQILRRNVRDTFRLRWPHNASRRARTTLPFMTSPAIPLPELPMSDRRAHQAKVDDDQDASINEAESAGSARLHIAFAILMPSNARSHNEQDLPIGEYSIGVMDLPWDVGYQIQDKDPGSMQST
jgi:hypothetical protein